MPPVLSRRELIAEIDTEHARLLGLIDRVPLQAWRSSRVNSAGWSLKDVLAHVTDWAERCEGWCTLGDSLDTMTPPAPGFKWTETRELNHAIYLKRRSYTLARVLKDYNAAHAALRSRAITMPEADLLSAGRFAWCGKTWSVAKHIRANTTAHDRWASKHFQRTLRALAKTTPEPKKPSVPSGASTSPRRPRKPKRSAQGLK
jgi:hypothetical protein